MRLRKVRLRLRRWLSWGWAEAEVEFEVNGEGNSGCWDWDNDWADVEWLWAGAENKAEGKAEAEAEERLGLRLRLRLILRWELELRVMLRVRVSNHSSFKSFWDCDERYQIFDDIFDIYLQRSSTMFQTCLQNLIDVRIQFIDFERILLLHCKIWISLLLWDSAHSKHQDLWGHICWSLNFAASERFSDFWHVRSWCEALFFVFFALCRFEGSLLASKTPSQKSTKVFRNFAMWDVNH